MKNSKIFYHYPVYHPTCENMSHRHALPAAVWPLQIDRRRRRPGEYSDCIIYDAKVNRGTDVEFGDRNQVSAYDESGDP